MYVVHERVYILLFNIIVINKYTVFDYTKMLLSLPNVSALPQVKLTQRKYPVSVVIRQGELLLGMYSTNDFLLCMQNSNVSFSTLPQSPF